MKMLNVGCGTRYHKDWTNVDMVSTGEGVIAANLLKGIPYPDNTFDVVYHSHVIEHFNRVDGKHFLSECVRVLKPNGTLRLLTPDLENIAQEYLKNMQQAIAGDKEADARYEWNLLEFYDQTVRNESQGEMGKVIRQIDPKKDTYILDRFGYEGIRLRTDLSSGGVAAEQKSLFSKLFSIDVWRNQLAKLFLGEKGFQQYQLGKFRLGGEIHYFMYDRYSMSKVLTELGMVDVKVTDARNSEIPNWGKYDLDVEDGKDYKPFSLIVEAKKA